MATGDRFISDKVRARWPCGGGAGAGRGGEGLSRSPARRAWRELNALAIMAIIAKVQETRSALVSSYIL